MKLILHWLILSASVWAVTKIVSGVSAHPISVVLIVGACLALFNMFIKPIINILTLPLNLVTLGLFSLVINGLIFWYLGTFVRGFMVANFAAAFIGALLVSIVNWVLGKILHID